MTSPIPTKGPNTSHSGYGPTPEGGTRYMALYDLPGGIRVQVEVVTPDPDENEALFDVVREAAKNAARTIKGLTP